MNNKGFVYLGLVIIVVILLVVVGVLLLTKDSEPTPADGSTSTPAICNDYALDETQKITDEDEKPQGPRDEKRSPVDNSELELIVLDPDDPNIMDEPWRNAYYSETQNVFWIADMSGFEVNWYGPFEGEPCQ